MSDDAEVRLLSATDVRRIAAALGIRPTKRLGQNFVIDANTVRRIVRAAGLEPDDCVLEVGPGLGSLTLALLPHARRVVAVEIDPVLARALPATVAERAPALADRLEVVAADALQLEPGHLEAGHLKPGHLEPGEVRAEPPGVPPTAVVANLPYNVAVPVLLHLFQMLPTLDHGLVMVQSEVADRLAAPPGSRTYGVPSVKAAWWARTYRAGQVSRAVFWPVPNVDSALVAFTRRDPPQTPATREDVFALVDAAFAQRRKSLRAALAGWAGSATAAEEALRAAGIDPSTRGEALAVEDFARLASHRPVLP